jgi:hypothetical protein
LEKNAALQIAVAEVAAVAILIKAGQNAAPAGHADGRGAVVVREAHALARQLVDVRRDHVLVPVASHRADGLIVGEDKDDVRAGGVSGGESAAQYAKQRGEKNGNGMSQSCFHSCSR